MIAPAAEIEQVRRDARLVCSAADVSAAIERMAGAAAAELAGECPVVIPIMLGGAFTAVHLVSHFDFAYELDQLQVRRYGAALEGGALQWCVRPRLALEGRSVLLVDDVLDRGITLAAVMQAMLDAGVARLRTAVLVDKHIADRVPLPGACGDADFVALDGRDEYLFGCGMDYKGYWRGLPALYALGPGRA